MNLNEIKFVKLNYGEDIGSIKHLGDGGWITPDGILYIKLGHYRHASLLPIICSDLKKAQVIGTIEAVAQEDFLCVDHWAAYGRNNITVLISPKVTPEQIISLYDWINVMLNKTQENYKLHLDIHWYTSYVRYKSKEEIEIDSKEVLCDFIQNVEVLCDFIQNMLKNPIIEEKGKEKLLKMMKFAETYAKMCKANPKNRKEVIVVEYGKSSHEGGPEGFVGLDGKQIRKANTSGIDHEEAIKQSYKEMGITTVEFVHHFPDIFNYTTIIKGMMYVGYYKEEDEEDVEENVGLIGITPNVTVEQISSLCEWWEEFNLIEEINILNVRYYTYDPITKMINEDLDSQRRFLDIINKMLKGQLGEKERANLLKMRELVQKCIEREGEDR